MLDVWVLGPEKLEEVADRLGAAGLEARVRSTKTVTALDSPTRERVYLVPADLLAGDRWPEFRTRLAQANRPFVVFGADLDSRLIVQACHDGAFDVVESRDPPARWADACTAAARSQETWLSLYGGAPLDAEAALVGASAALLALRRTIDRLGPTPASVLLLGESGVGKEKVAQALHQAGSKGPFVAINCATLPANLIESELFGVTKGAFTHAVADRPGLVEQADGGTLLLDEIGELELSLQARLLRFLETRKARRIGSNREYAVNVRVLSATNRDLDADVAAGRFRTDLFYRLAEITLRIPPLRERPADIPLLARHFLSLAGERFGKFFDTIEPELIVRWQTHPWPGNVRELKSTLDRLVLLHDGPVLRASSWEAPVIRTEPSPLAPTTPLGPTADPPRDSPRLPGRRDRLQLARQLLAEPGHELTWVAAQVGVHPTTLFRWRKAGRI